MANVNLASITFPGLNDTYIIPSEIAYINTITSTNADIEAALADDKIPFLSVNNGLDPSDFCWYVGKESSTKHYFSCIKMDGKALVAICNNNTWSFSRVAIPTSAADVGAIAAPSSPTVGDFLVYTSNGWGAVTLSAWQGGSF